MSQDTAADGTRLPTFQTFNQFLGGLEDGNLINDMTEKMRDLVSDMENHVLNYGGKVSGEIALKLKFNLTKGVFEIEPNLSVKSPIPPRGKSIMWPAGKGKLSPHNPAQMQMFGSPREVRDPSSGDVRSA